MGHRLFITPLLIITLITNLWQVGLGSEFAPSGQALTRALAAVPVTEEEGILAARVRWPVDDHNPGETINGLRELEQALLAPLAPGILGSEIEQTLRLTGQGYFLHTETSDFELKISLKTIPNSRESAYLHVQARIRDLSLFHQADEEWSQYFTRDEYSSLLIGTFDGELSYNEQESILQDVFATLKARGKGKIRDGHLISWDGYSPQLAGSIQDVQGRSINIQGALRYRSQENRTYLHLGTPLIYGDY